MYTIYINKMADIVNNYDTCKDDIHRMSLNLFNDECKNCGAIFGYADDTTYQCTSKLREENQTNIIEALEKIKTFLETNNLNINTSKITLLEIMLQQK